MSYTNGFDQDRVMAAMLTRIGFRQPTIADCKGLVAGDNLTTLSGRYFDDFHALVRVKNIKDTQEDANINDADFNAYLTSLKKGVIMRCLNSVLGVPEQLERVLLFNKDLNSPRQLIVNDGSFVGFQIDIAKDDTISVQPINVILNFTEDVTFKLYAFLDGKKTKIWEQQVSAVADEQTVVAINPDFILNYAAQTKGARFFIGYFQDDLGSAQAVRFVNCWNQTCCFCIESIISKATGGDFDRVQIRSTFDTYGINIEFVCFQDHTNAVIKKAALFDEAVGLQMAYSVIEQIVYATQSNSTERRLRDDFIRMAGEFDLQGSGRYSESTKVQSLRERIEQEFDRVREGFYPKPTYQTVNTAKYDYGYENITGRNRGY